jgi:[CysO sulfur-carrier protein]-S-L-cysteine hydrolase
MRIGRDVLDAIVAHARAEAPLECCGLLIGSADEIDESVPAENVRRSATRFEIDPGAHFAAIRKARAAGRSVVGAYHSHPASPAMPSETDVREANDSYLLHVIVSLAAATPQVGAFYIRDGCSVSEALDVIERGSRNP